MEDTQIVNRERFFVTNSVDVTINLGEDEEPVVVKVRADKHGKPGLPWRVQQRIVSESVKFDTDGESTSFDADAYLWKTLKELIIEAPWGEIDEEFMDNINSDLGTALTMLVPSVNPEVSVSFNEIKKE